MRGLGGQYSENAHLIPVGVGIGVAVEDGARNLPSESDPDSGKSSCAGGEGHPFVTVGFNRIGLGRGRNCVGVSLKGSH